MTTNTEWVDTTHLLVQAVDEGITLRHENGELIIAGTSRQLAHLGARIIGFAVRNHTGSVTAHSRTVDAVDKLINLVIVEE